MLFGALVGAQALHSVEEYAGRLYESFPPARFVSGLVSADLERGFVIANIALIAVGLLCWLGPVRRGWAQARAIAWTWAVVEASNFAGHTGWSVWNRGYTPGVATAPLLLLCSVLVMRELRFAGD